MKTPKPLIRLSSILLEERGLALLITLIALSLFSLLGFYMAFNATTEVRISDNHESQLQARSAAQAGLNHARELLKGLNFNDLLAGPDGTYTNTSSYLAQARTFAFRNPVAWTAGRSLDILSPGGSLTGIPDDGLVSTGKYGTTNGTVLVPLAGIAQTAPNPYGSGTVTTSRYFVKVTDNNGEAAELAKDPLNNPFVDGDGIIIVRSMGVAQTIRETAGGTVRRNSIAAYEARFKRSSTFEIDAPLLVEGNAVLPSQPNMFDGNSFDVFGGLSNPGIATIDVNASDGTFPTQQMSSQLAPNQNNNITGLGPNPSIVDITASVSADADKALLLNQNYLYNFVTNTVPKFADQVFTGNQSWNGGSAPDLGYFDLSKPTNDPSQRPRVLIVLGDLDVSGNLDGGGLLVVHGKLSGSGHFRYVGLILVIGAGEIDFSGLNLGIWGGVYVVNVVNSGGVITFGTPKVTLAGNSNIYINSQAIKMAVELIPADQLSWREIVSNIDP